MNSNESIAIINAHIVTPIDHGKAKSGSDQKRVSQIHNGVILIEDGLITVVGSKDQVAIPAPITTLDAQGALVTPGLIDPHTHVVHGGSREHEVSLKLEGASYMQIHQAGGGINSTVQDTRQHSVEQLVKRGRSSVLEMLVRGVTTLESKSGYGLSTETELKMLQASHLLADETPVELVHTFMGAHSIPQEYKNNEEDYVQLVIEEMLPAVKEWASFCDVFCEKGVFSIAQTQKILEAARKHNLGLKMHADEIEPIGGAELAASLKVTSADHLMAASENGLRKMAAVGVVAVVLPGTSFYLRKEYAKARRMIQLGVPVALATDYNPGSCPSENFQLIMTLAYLYLRMAPEEILTACTLNSAYAIGRASLVGSIEVGKQGDLVIWNADNLNYLVYHFGINHVDTVIKRGQIVVKGGNYIE